MTHRSIFLDRDGTLVHPRHYPSRPEDLIVYEGIGPQLHFLQGAGFKLVVITNQSGIARGLFTEADLQSMHEHLRRELAADLVHLDGIYHCPHHVEGIFPELAVSCDCRKPEPGMLLRAADDLDIDLSRSWLVGDILDDVEAGNRVGCRTILVDLGTEPVPPSSSRQPSFVARDTRHALRIIATMERLGSTSDLAYLPPSWKGAVPETRAMSGGVNGYPS